VEAAGSALGSTPIRTDPRRRGALIVQERVQIGGFQTRALRVAGKGPAAVLLHGYGDSADTWRQVLARLAREGRSAVALDLPGFAAADDLGPEPVLVQLAAFAQAAVERYAVRRRGAVLVGNSLGGAAALLAARDEGAHLRGVVAIAPAGFDMAGWIYRMETLSLLQVLLRMPVVPGSVLRTIVARIYTELVFHDRSAADRHLIGSFVGHYRDRETVARYLDIARRMRPELSERFDLGDVRVPVHVLWGRHDRMLAVAGAELVRAAIPHAELEILEDCGHCPQVERPYETSEILVRVLSGA
jgi:pimeloyl-ACP methyl ester carboxylesterase